MAPKFLEALVALWKASDRLCSKRLKPLIPIFLPALERHGRLDLGRGEDQVVGFFSGCRSLAADEKPMLEATFDVQGRRIRAQS